MTQIKVSDVSGNSRKQLIDKIRDTYTNECIIILPSF